MDFGKFRLFHRDLNSTPTAANTASINLFKKFEISKSEQRLLKGGNDIIIDDTMDSIIIDDTMDS